MNNVKLHLKICYCILPYILVIIFVEYKEIEQKLCNIKLRVKKIITQAANGPTFFQCNLLCCYNYNLFPCTRMHTVICTSILYVNCMHT